MTYPIAVQRALDAAWDKSAAEKSLTRWLTVAQQEHWDVPDHLLVDLVRLFGCSWYFTRFVFFQGKEVFPIFIEKFDLENSLIHLSISVIDASRDDLEQALQLLYRQKNEIMLAILLAHLRGEREPEQVELELSLLAERVLCLSIELCGWPIYEDPNVVVVGMGRLAGLNMNYGSDLDLIFLYQGDDAAFEKFSKIMRKALRIVSTASAAGMLYEIDMRLRPHGSAGTLVTSYDSFFDYHSKVRDIWERQMMTRCRPLNLDPANEKQFMSALHAVVYRKYPDDILRKEISTMRHCVQDEFGNLKNKFDVKRSSGGMMDIDFIAHYIQLSYGKQYPELQICSTRNVIKAAQILGLLEVKIAEYLLKSYAFLKQVECCLRLTDLKSVSQFSKCHTDLIPLARGMGFMATDDAAGAASFLASYLATTKEVRTIFDEIFTH